MPERGHQRGQTVARPRIGARGQRRRPPARPQEQLPADRPVPARELRIGPQPSGQGAVDPMPARRVGDAALSRLRLNFVHREWSGSQGSRRQGIRIAVGGSKQRLTRRAVGHTGQQRFPTASAQGMNVLLIGSGGREHALAWKLAASPLLTKLYAAPGNPGIAKEAELVALDIADHAAVAVFCREKTIDLVVVGPEAPLVAGLADDLRAPASRFSARRRPPRSSKDRRVSPRISARARTFRPPPMAASPLPRRRRPMSASRVRRSSSRPTGLPPARA